MIKGFDAAVANMEVGQVVDVHLMPEEVCRISINKMKAGRSLRNAESGCHLYS